MHAISTEDYKRKKNMQLFKVPPGLPIPKM